jgi:3-keto-disaccharide hydrolase
MKRTLLLMLICGCTCGGSRAAGPAAPGPWQSLLEESSASAWRGWKEPGLPAGWHVSGGVLSKNGEVDDLVTRASYTNFELELEWKIGKAGNSGIFYRGTHEYDHIYWSAPEYQLLDDANTPDGRSRLTAAGSVYALYPSPAGVVRPYDHWNRARVVVRGTHVEHWLNGVKVLEYEIESADWKRRVAASKFATYPHYGLAGSGLIGLQGDHPGELAIRRIRIREISATR